MYYPITAKVFLHSPVVCAYSGCNNPVDDATTAVFVVRSIMVVSYCCNECYLNSWRDQIDQDEEYRQKDPLLDELGYYSDRG